MWKLFAITYFTRKHVVVSNKILYQACDKTGMDGINIPEPYDQLSCLPGKDTVQTC